MFAPDRKLGRLGREVDGDDGSDVGNRKLISRDKGHVGEPGVEVGVEIPDALLASLYQSRDLLIIMRAGDGATLETWDSVANRFHHGGKSFHLDAAFPHCNLRPGLWRDPKQRRLGMNFLEIAQD